MSDDLVKRLRHVAEYEGSPDFGMWTEAADRIEELELLTKDLMLQLDELDFLKWEGGEESIGREIERAKAEARNAALEEAAGAALAVPHQKGGDPWADTITSEICAKAIRALKTEPKP
jgi:hypothetical protein